MQLSAAIGENSMSNPDAEYEAKYDAFIAEIKQTGEVWGLCTDEDDWAVCASSAYEDTDVMPFWSNQATAKAQCVGEWAVFHAQAIPLEDFINDWLPGMHEDDVLIGPNWDENLEGLEIEPADVALELEDEDPAADA
jgi:hypothetical protein